MMRKACFIFVLSVLVISSSYTIADLEGETDEK